MTQLDHPAPTGRRAGCRCGASFHIAAPVEAQPPPSARRSELELVPRLGLLAALALMFCAGGAAAQPGSAPLRVLFVGNSLTATNDLPAVVGRIARSHGRRLEYRTVEFGGYALEDHWAQGDARAGSRPAGGTWS